MSDSSLVTMHGRAGLVAAVPSLLGFQPADCLVMVGLSRDRPRRLQRAVRVGHEYPVEAVPDMLAGYAVQAGDDVVLLAYGPRFGDAELITATLQAFDHHGVCVLDVLNVTGRAVRIGRPGDPVEEIPTLEPTDPEVVALTSALALDGRQVLSDRAELARSVAGPRGRAAVRRSAQAFRTAGDSVLRMLENAPQHPDPMRVRARRVVDEALADTLERGTIDVGTAAMLAVLAGDVLVRDDMIEWAIRETRGWTPMLVCAVGQLLDRHAVPVLAVLAVSAYRGGDGALANVTLDRIFTVDPTHRLAHLLGTIIRAGLSPDAVAEMLSPATTPAQ